VSGTRSLTLLALLLCACRGVAHPEDPQRRPYQAGDLALLASYTAKESCSCLYVMEMGEDYCRAFTKASPAVASWSVDRGARTVRASALVLWRASARFVSDEIGCVLE
jgi:hypothetical protein